MLTININFISINVNGLRDAEKCLGFLHLLSHLALTVVYLQEMHCLLSSELSFF